MSVVFFSVLFIFRTMKQNSSRISLTADYLKLKYAVINYKGEYFSFPKLILNDYAYLKFGGICCQLLECYVDVLR